MPYEVSVPRYLVAHHIVTTAFEIMIQHATEPGANANTGARYDITEIASGVTEVLWPTARLS